MKPESRKWVKRIAAVGWPLVVVLVNLAVILPTDSVGEGVAAANALILGIPTLFASFMLMMDTIDP